MEKSSYKVDLGSTEEILIFAKKSLSNLKLSETENYESLYRQLSQQFPGHPGTSEIKEMFSSFLKLRYGEYLSGGFEHSDQLNAYVTGWTKKLDITKDIQGFSEIARSVIAQKRTLLFYDRLYTIFQAMMNTRKIGGDIVELGVYRGGSLRFIYDVARYLKTAPCIYGLDTFSGHAGVSAEDISQADGQFSKNSLEQVAAYLADCDSVRLVPGDVRETLESLLGKIECLVFAHLDLDLHDPTASALRLIEPKLAVGGAIVVDDYGVLSCKGVRKATDEFVAQSALKQFHLMTGQCLLLKVA